MCTKASQISQLAQGCDGEAGAGRPPASGKTATASHGIGSHSSSSCMWVSVIKLYGVSAFVIKKKDHDSCEGRGSDHNLVLLHYFPTWQKSERNLRSETGQDFRPVFRPSLWARGGKKRQSLNFLYVPHHKCVHARALLPS